MYNFQQLTSLQLTKEQAEVFAAYDACMARHDAFYEALEAGLLEGEALHDTQVGCGMDVSSSTLNNSLVQGVTCMLVACFHP